MSPEASETPTTRATLLNAPTRYRPDIDRWAIIVGISKYQHAGMNLKWAHRDAEELYQLLLTPAGGSFAADHVQLLVDAQATAQAISRALRSFLKKPAKDDVVLIYFACHGGPDPDRPNNLYLLTHDTDPDDIAGTALPMREIDLSLRENLLAERVVILADTCHSAGIGGGIGRRSATVDAGVVNAYLDALSAARGGLALLTSAEASETSQEDARWGGGHGVFTHYLLEGMRGAADGFNQPRDGKVAVGELFDYVRHQVQQATGNSQHPAIGSNPFDRDLPLAITGGIDAQEHLELGRCLYELARIADEPDRYHAAARQFEEALRLASLGGIALPAANWRLAQAWLAAGDADRAMAVLARLQERAGEELPPAALFMLGLAQAAQGEAGAAIISLRKYLEQHPGDAFASWGRYCLALLEHPVVPRALLIGIGKHAPGEYERWKFSGPANDVELIKGLLITDYGFPEDRVTVLLDEQATWQAIEQALQDLARHAQSNDPVIVYIASMGFIATNKTDGSSAEDAAPEPNRLLTYDGPIATVEQLHARLLAIPSSAKTLIVDGMPSKLAIELADQAGDYALLLAAEPGQSAKERPFGDSRHGVFSYYLAQAMGAPHRHATLKEVFDQTREMVQQHRSEQTPVLAGKSNQRFGAAESKRHYNQLSAFEQWVYQAETLDDLTQAYERFQALSITPYAQAHLSFGRAFLAHGGLEQAIAALTTTVNQEENVHSLLALGKAQVAARQYAAARDTFRRLLAQPSSAASPHVQSLIEQADGLVNLQRHALVVGIDRYLSPDMRAITGAANDAWAMRDALVQRLGFQPENVVLLLDEEATRERVMMEFRTLVKKAEHEPALFYFGGYGSTQHEARSEQRLRTRTLVCTDSRSENVGEFGLTELAREAASAKHLVSIADISQVEQREVASSPATRDVIDRKPLDAPDKEDWTLLGRVSVYAQGALELQRFGESLGREHGHWTFRLLQVLEKSDPNSLTYRSWVEEAQRVTLEFSGLNSMAEPILLGSVDERPFDLMPQREAVLATAARIELDAVYRVIDLLTRQIGERQQQGAIHPDGWLNLGVAFGVVGDYEQALAALEAAVAATTPAKMEMNQVAAHGVTPEEIAPEISYHLGRLLLAAQTDFSRAVSELKKATQQDPGDARAWYYLGQAIRERIRRETLAEVESAFSAYLAAGAPVGHRREVVEFLRERKESSPTPPTR
jgi:tetratricopeptide (TPR) repeat protein